MEKAFLEYVSNFDLSQLHIRRKRDHTLRTAKVSVKIARAMGLDDENVFLAYAIGILHDIARFEQWTKYKTFADAESIDHGDRACEILFDEGLIEKFGIDKKYYDIIKFAVKNHNKYKISGQGAMLQAQIIRDADKVDIARQLAGRAGNARQVYRFFPDKSDGISPKVLECINNKQLVEHKLVKTRADSIIGSISFAYDLYTTPAKKIFVKNKYPLLSYKKYKDQLCEKDRAVVAKLAEKVLADLKSC